MTTSYDAAAAERLAALRNKKSAAVLAVETSCDETAAAVVLDGRTACSNVVHTQIPLHKRFGGVVPEIASRNHVEAVGPVVRQALDGAGFALADIEAVAVTNGPGLVGALLVGVSFAKGLAAAMELPLVGTNHIASHIAANYLTYPDLVPPFCCLIASGGHSHIVSVDDYDRFTLLGRTRDDAAGEALDKVARLLELPYPGGPALEKLAETGDPFLYRFHSAFNEGAGFDFSFSGLKTAVVNLLHTSRQRGETVDRASVAASFQAAVVAVLAGKAVRAVAPGGTLALAGGVSANAVLRAELARRCEQKGVRFCCPDPAYCTDNAAMVGSAGFYSLMAGHRSGLGLNAFPDLPIV